MLKKLISAALAAAMFFTCTQFVLAEGTATDTAAQAVEIKFTVGDSTLSINGNDLAVETPYISGIGTTLVPLRVITEAFGAKVTWEGTEQKITLEYPQVNVVMYIGSTETTVNTHTETLPEAPALSVNGVTMVPLRFISETFGAKVGYDNGKITVTKAAADSGKTVTAVTDAAKIGDSYYGWSMTTPKNFTMTDRTFDGTKTIFEAKESKIAVEIAQVSGDTTFDEDFENIKDSVFSKMTLTAADKNADSISGIKTMHFNGKTSDYTLDMRVFVKDGKNYSLYTQYTSKVADEVKAEADEIAESFAATYTTDSAYDLSTVVNGYRTFKDDKYKVSFRVPADWVKDTNSEAENEFRFYDPHDDTRGKVSLEIYAKTDTYNAKTIAEKDRGTNDSYLNDNKTTVSAVTAEKIGGTGISGYYYTAKTTGTTSDNTYFNDMFFDLGDYTYNFTIQQDAYDETQFETIFKSFSAQQLDSAVIGNLIRNDFSDTDRTIKSDAYSFAIPSVWTAAGPATDDGVLMSNQDTGSSLTLLFGKKANLNPDVYNPKTADTFAAKQAKKIGGTVESSAQSMSVDGKSSDDNHIYKVVLKTTKNKKVTYITYFFDIEGDYLAEFILADSEAAYNSKTKNDVISAIQSLKIVK